MNTSQTEEDVKLPQPKPGRSKNSASIPLYKRLRFSDNYTDPNFLADLELNPSLRYWTLPEAIEKSTRLAFQLSVSVVFFVFYSHLSNELVQPLHVIKTCWISSVVAHFIFQTYRYWPMRLGLEWLKVMFPTEHFKVTMIYIMFSYQLAPILRTLTATISTDTIYATSIIMISAHLLTNDYGVPGFFVSKTISVNTAIIGAICLASRLSSDTHSLALLTLAVQCFALFPMFSSILWDSSICLLIVVLSVAYACLTISINYVLTYLCVILFVNGVIPAIFVSSQKFKRNVYGPWDEAVPNRAFTKRGYSQE